MIPKKNDYTIGNLFQFSPYIIFLVIYSSLYLYTLHAKNIYNSSTIIFAGLPLFTAFIATIYSFFTFKDSLKIDKKIEIFLSGVAHIATMNYCFNIIFIAVFNHLIAKTNGVLTAVTLGLLYIPTLWMMPAIFLIASIFSIMIFSLPAAIIIFMPIACGIAQSLQINSAFMAATIIGGALFGTHVSLYFNNFAISRPLNLRNIFQKTFWFVIAAAISTLFILSKYECVSIHPAIYNHLQSSLTMIDYIAIIPYCFLLIGGILNINNLANLVIACCITLTIEIICHKILLIDSITTMFCGFYGESMIVNIVLFHMIIAGLVKIIQNNGGFNFIIEKLKLKTNQNSSSAQASIIAITIVSNMLIIIDLLCLSLITHPVRRFADKYNISQNRATSLLYITTTTMQSVLPYASIMFITINITRRSYVEIITYMIYPILITTFTMISIFISNSQAEYKKHYHNHKI